MLPSDQLLNAELSRFGQEKAPSEDTILCAMNALDRFMPWWVDLTQARQRVMIVMCVDVVISSLMTFTNTINAIKKSHYELASVNMLHTDWAKKDGVRARRLSLLMVSG